jgi:cobalt-precorrin 5A hydrolase/precorrin-3B C17-methyltransferase
MEQSGAWLAQRWGEVGAVVAVGACGLVTRLIAPLLGDKNRDPAVVVIDPEGRFAIPLLGGHAAGGERLSEQIAALLGGQAVHTGASVASGRLALDSFGSTWGWKRGAGDWTTLMARAATGQPIGARQESGLEHWRQLPAAEGLQKTRGGEGAAGRPEDLVVSHRRGEECRWHPPCLWLGIGCERATSLQLLERLVEGELREHNLAPEAVAGLASIDRKGDEPALLALAERHNWPLKLFQADDLAAVPVPNPSERVAREMGTASVAEAAALLAAQGAGGGDPGSLLVPKRPWRWPWHRSSGRPSAAPCIWWAAAREPWSCSPATPAAPWPPPRSGWATAFTSIYWSPSGAPTSCAAKGGSLRNGNAAPRPWSWPSRGSPWP